ncbi:hypothetical protein VMCG_05745 [Cytospora schulzeri]|uniref:Rhodopsin domain-containing protein n=1 Tax=Cytospora schulzeri TaxID=448051 RepID=A0A423WIN1_9PEZI|nr:hypothetical protein VMCG_05745 [Valsa malicola]
MAQTYQQTQDSLVVLSIVFTALSTIAVLSRTLIRVLLIRSPSYDDYSILVALIFTIGYMGEILVGKANHVGFPASMLTVENMVNLLKDALAIEVTYYMILGFIKISILFMYLRFAVSEIFRYLCYGTIFFQLGFTVICVCVTLAQCLPMRKQWDVTKTVQGSCINSTAFFYTTAGINIITDIWVIVLPIRTLRGINRPLKEKIALTVIFGAGLFATLMSVVRLRSIHTYTLTSDPFRDAIQVNVWSVIEVNVAILCASVPALKPIFRPHRLRELRRKNQYKYRGREDSSYGGYSHEGRLSRGVSNVTGGADPFALPTPSPDERGNDLDNIVDECDRRGETYTHR